MGSSYLGEPKFGNERGSGSSSSSSSSSRKGKKNNCAEKPKQPQRGLGVAQLEKIRLHGQMACATYHPSLQAPPYPSHFNNEDPRVQMAYSSVPSSSFTYSSSPTSSSYAPSYVFQPNIMMGLTEYQKTNIGYGDSDQQTNIARWEATNVILESQSYAPSNITRPFINQNDSQDIDAKRHRNGSVGSSSQNSESSDTQELDLELRLSL